MKHHKTRIILVLMLFASPLITTSCAKYGCPANQALYNETMGITKKEGKQNAKSISGVKPPAKTKKKRR